jgi:predicted cupin superfamily sugar epimerase
MLAGYSLVGCTVSPGFDFADFELAEEEELLTGWPAHADLISSLCRHA